MVVCVFFFVVLGGCFCFLGHALRCGFRRSDLVLDADHALDVFFLSDLAFQACISFYSVLDKSGARMFLPCSIKNAVAHLHVLKVFPEAFYIR